MEDQAFVTCATNDTYALGALVLAHSLRNVQTSGKLAVIITQDVSDKISEQLHGVFDHVEVVNVLDSGDETNLALLTRPDLGVTFTKFHCWRLTRFKKCVFLDADIIVVQNCDELFEKEELSAVPDVGWPDCFNSGVFVYQPNEETYKSILTFAITHGSFDGGDQGVLNMFFSDWRTADISKHLSFIYNMNANVTYTYLPAYKQFGKDVKIVHFLGAIKPWMQAYNSETGQVEPSSPHSLEHLQMWWNIFISHVQPNLSQECKGLAGDLARLHLCLPSSQKYQSSEARQHAWERGQIDYMGADAFEHIERKLQSAIEGTKEIEDDAAKGESIVKSQIVDVRPIKETELVRTTSRAEASIPSLPSPVAVTPEATPEQVFTVPQKPQEQVAAPSEQVSVPLEQAAAPSEQVAAPSGQVAALSPEVAATLDKSPAEPAVTSQRSSEQVPPTAGEAPKQVVVTQEKPPEQVPEAPKEVPQVASTVKEPQKAPKAASSAKEPAKAQAAAAAKPPASTAKEAEKKSAPKKEPQKKEPAKKPPQKKGGK